MNFPYLQTNNKEINTAYRLAIATLAANILPFQDGILTRPEPVIIAGLGYSTPWTRDAAINTWNAGALICPEISRSTLESVRTAFCTSAANTGTRSSGSPARDSYTSAPATENFWRLPTALPSTPSPILKPRNLTPKRTFSAVRPAMATASPPILMSMPGTAPARS